MRKELAGSATADISGASEEVRQEPLLGTALRQAGCLAESSCNRRLCGQCRLAVLIRGSWSLLPRLLLTFRFLVRFMASLSQLQVSTSRDRYTVRWLVQRDTFRCQGAPCSSPAPPHIPQIIYKIDIPANRYDMLCLEGIARALNVFRGREAPPQYRLADMGGAPGWGRCALGAHSAPPPPCRLASEC